MEPPQILEVPADRALFEGNLRAMVLTIGKNERPLRGLASLIDWRLQGAISFGLKSGVVTGEAGEIAYMPVHRRGRTIHLILVGAGQVPEGSKRKALPVDTLRKLQGSLTSLRLGGLGISRSDLGDPSDEAITQAFRGIALSVVP